MSCPLTRRQFLGTTAAGSILLAAQPGVSSSLGASEEGWPEMPPVRIHKVFVGRTGDIYMSRPTEEIGKLNEYLAGVEKKIGGIQFTGGDLIPPAEAASVLANISGADGVMLFHLSGHGGGSPAEAMDQIVNMDIQTAVFSQPFSGHGWMYFPRWQKAGKKVVLLPTSDWSELDRVVGLMRVAPRLRQTKILVVRGPIGTAPACSAETVKARSGIEIVPISVEETLEAHRSIDLAAAEAEAERYWIGCAKQIVEPTRDEIVNASRFYLALKKLMLDHGARAVTSSNCMGEPAKGCFAFSKLNDLGLVGTCEGDMDSTLTMLMFQYAFDVPGFVSDPVFDTARNALIHFHCTCATKMDGCRGERLPFSIRTQTDSGRGVALDVEMRVGQPVTCGKFINLDTMLISTGKITEVTHDALACRTQFVTEVPDARKMFLNWGGGVLEGDVMTLLHRVVCYGDRLQSMRDLGSLMGFRVVEEA
ncbi:MAG TPA: hypothetical protein PKO36_04205 [Candidatus Hydrogenedentes bacterium]|nr:hypothetical protein [Candidatus Hydrogenedentota bacterium]